MADTKTTALTAATSWASGDLLYLVRDPAGTPVSRKITVDNILQNLVCAANTSLIKSTTGYSLTGSNAQSMIDLAGTLNTTGSPAIIKVAMSNTASGATTKFLSCLAGASGTTEVLAISVAGALTLGASGPVLVPNYAGSGRLQITDGSNGVLYVGEGTTGTTVKYLGLSTNPGPTAPDVYLYRDAANTLALRNGANAQALNIYNTYTSGSVYERGFMRWVSNVLEIGTEHVGASARGIALKIGSTAAITIATSGNITLGSGVNTSPGGGFLTTGRGGFYMTTDGVMKLQDNADTGVFRLCIGGTTSSFPALKRSSTILQSRLADDSDFAPLQGQLRSHANATAETPTATHTVRMYDAAGTEYRVLAIAV